MNVTTERDHLAIHDLSKLHESEILERVRRIDDAAKELQDAKHFWAQQLRALSRVEEEGSEFSLRFFQTSGRFQLDDSIERLRHRVNEIRG